MAERGKTGGTVAELKRELAVALFAQGRLSLGRAMEVDRISFQQFFGDRGIATVYGGVADRLGEEADLLREGLLGWGNRGFEWIAGGGAATALVD